MSFANQDYDAGGGRSVATLDSAERPQEGSFSVIDRFSSFDGTFTADRDLRVDGEVKGTIECKGTLFVAEGATVNARVKAENITVAGELTGDIDCTGRLRLLPSGKLQGQVKTRGFVIAQGAIYDGELVMESSGATTPETTTDSQPPTQPEAARQTRQTGSRPTRPAPDSTPTSEGATPSTFIRRLGGPETPWEEQPADTATPERETGES